MEEGSHVQISRCERLVSKVGIVLKGEGELAVAKVVGWCRAMVQPLEEIPPREETLVEAAHDLGI